MVLAADDYPLTDLLWTFVLFFSLMIWCWLIITAFGDLFRRHDMSGWARTAWVVVILLLPLVGALTYLVTQGRGMSERHVREVQASERQTDDYIRSVAVPGLDGIDEIARGKELLDRGAISQEEFEQLKRRVLV
jgi:hypothetical protein